jgi:hypothetical protein
MKRRKPAAKQQLPATTPLMIGARDFRRFVHRTEPEWSVWAVEAPLHAVASALADLTGGEIWSSDILDTPRAANGADISKITPVVAVKGGAWVVGYRTVGFFMSDEAALANDQASQLSRKLNTRAVAYHREDKSGVTFYELFERGKSAGEFGGDDVAQDFPDDAFRELGLVVPACALWPHDGKVELDVSPESKGYVDRACLIYAST